MISILGCGWLGCALGRALHQQGYTVQGSTQTPAAMAALRSDGIKPFCLNVDEGICAMHQQEFFQADLLCVFLPFRRSMMDPFQYPRQMQAIGNALKTSPVQAVLFSSSTSIYPQYSGLVTEDTPFMPNTQRAQALQAAEAVWLATQSFKASVIRFAGLCGPERPIGRFLAGRTSERQGGALEGARPVNLIHLEDCLAIVQRIMELGAWGEIFNACCDQHPTRQELYTEQAFVLGVPPPAFASAFNAPHEPAYKIVSNVKLKQRLGYTFRYPDPRKFPLSRA